MMLTTQAAHPYVGSALKRWKIGHQLFFVAIQSIITAIWRYDARPSDDRLRLVADLIKGSAAIMQFTADFSAEAYGEVRDSMAGQEPDFSGLYSVDHRLMITELIRLKRGASPNSVAYCELLDAIEVAYEAHKYVCKQFVGNGPSLKNEHGEGYKALDNFKQRTRARVGTKPNKRSAI